MAASRTRALVGAAITVAALGAFVAGALPAQGGRASIHRVAGVASAAMAAPVGPAAQFRPVGPDRLADTRRTDCGCTRLDNHTVRVVVAGRVGIPEGITAAAVTITATGNALAGYVAVYPAGGVRPETSTVTLRSAADPASAVSSNSTIASIGANGALDLFSNVPVDVIVDVTGVFTAAPAAAAGRFQPVAPARLVDTRTTQAAGLAPLDTLTVALPAGVGADALAVAVNVTSVGDLVPGYVNGYPAGAAPTLTSFMNPDGTGHPRAATVVLPVSAQGFTLGTTAGGHLVVDLVGWFSGPSAPVASTGLFVPVSPTRLLDTRAAGPRLWPSGGREIALPVAGAAALVTNITIDRTDASGYVVGYPAGTPLPATSSLNATGRDATVANMAITTVSDRGTGYFSNAGTDVIVDLNGYFTGTPVAATLEPPANVMPRHRVLLVGDSTLGALSYVTASSRAMTNFDYRLDAANCRRISDKGCKSDFSSIEPTTVVEAIRAAPGSYDVVVVKAGYNDPLSPFLPNLNAVMTAARAKGARIVIWFTFSNSASNYEYLLRRNSQTLRDLAGSAQYPELVAADWGAYSAPSSGWYVLDRRHLTVPGAWATADYISRYVAAVTHQPCLRPWTAGEAAADPCPNPDAYAAATASLPGLKALYGF